MSDGIRAVPFERRARQAFGGILVDRAQGVRARLGGQLPGFLSEYLIAAHGLEAASRLVADHWPTARNLYRLKYKLLTDRTIDLLDYLEVAVDLDEETTKGRLTAFQYACPVSPEILDRWPDVLSGGMWGRVTLSMDPPNGGGTSDTFDVGRESGWGPVGQPIIVDFEPYQVSVDVRSLVEARHRFSTEEWIDLLLSSAGYNPAWIRAQPNGQRLTRLYLMRLIPLVERNVNLIELGPKNTGKTHLLRNLTPHAYTVAGGQATPANLFVNLATQAAGLIQSRRVILFDEVARLEFSRHRATLSLLKDYMESGQFSRGRASYGSDTSLVFMGNLDVQGQRPASRYRHLFQVLPSALQDTAVLDRLHCFIPGWEFPKLTPQALHVGLALASDYFGEVLLSLRDWPYDKVWSDVQRRWPPRRGLTRRDVVALDRTGRALFKLVFPDGVLDDEVAVELLSLAAEGRQRIHEQLVKMEPGEFISCQVGFEGIFSKTDDLWAVETPLDRKINRTPRPGESSGACGGADSATGSVSADVVVIHVVRATSGTRATVWADEGLVGVQTAWQVARFYLDAHQTALGLDSVAHWEGLGVQLSGGPGDVRGRIELAIVLAVVSAWLRKPLAPALAAIGGLTLTGEVTVPPDMLALVMAALNRGRTTIVVPSGSSLSLLETTFGPQFPHMRLVPVSTAEEVLRWGFWGVKVD